MTKRRRPLTVRDLWAKLLGWDQPTLGYQGRHRHQLEDGQP